MGVDENSPQIQQKINELMEQSKPSTITLDANIYVEKILTKIGEIAKERIANGVPEHEAENRWIIDGYPNTKEDWNAMSELGLSPDDLIIIRDGTDKNENIIEKKKKKNFQKKKKKKKKKK